MVSFVHVRAAPRVADKERNKGGLIALIWSFFSLGREGCSEADLVPAKIANVEAPQDVIRFYESRLSWHDNDDGVGEACIVYLVACGSRWPDTGMHFVTCQFLAHLSTHKSSVLNHSLSVLA